MDQCFGQVDNVKNVGDLMGQKIDDKFEEIKLLLNPAHTLPASVPSEAVPLAPHVPAMMAPPSHTPISTTPLQAPAPKMLEKHSKKKYLKKYFPL
mmetsp:Transcript_11283/g.14763  ORF Transcript_11283/g.14763 Transcript_11283/m.14763 type:complete len:95 (+) Transcript_11283:1082-1366(+)